MLVDIINLVALQVSFLHKHPHLLQLVQWTQIQTLLLRQPFYCHNDLSKTVCPDLHAGKISFGFLLGNLQILTPSETQKGWH